MDQVSRKVNMRGKRRKRSEIWKRIVGTMAIIVVFCTVYALVLPAITLSDEPVCGQEAHEHTDACYRTRLLVSTCAAASHVHSDSCWDSLGNPTCGFGERILHTHDSSCKDERGKLICELPELQEHLHSDACQTTEQTLICPMEESMGHVHGEDCAVNMVLVCEEPEVQGHQHEDACYVDEQVLICEQAEQMPHGHTAECYGKSSEPVCGQEHTHEDGCYEAVLQCTLEETAGHAHTDSCYQLNRTLICDLEEAVGHAHDEQCYKKELACTEPEGEGHIHSDACFDVQITKTCELEQVAVHEHTVSCYDENGERICGLLAGVVHVHDETCFKVVQLDEPEMICELPEHVHVDACFLDKGDLPPVEKEFLCDMGEHIHTEECYDDAGALQCNMPEHTHDVSCKVSDYDPEAGVETAEDWDAMFADTVLSGKWPEDLLSVAVGQIGYRESKQNVILHEDGSVKGYTRYGAWYGAPYIDWSAAFVSFCTHYAQVDAMPQDASCEAYHAKLVDAGLFRTVDTYLPKRGDVVLLDLDTSDDAVNADRLGIVAELIANDVGEYAMIKVLLGDNSDQVDYLTYDLTSKSIIGYGETPAGEMKTLLCSEDHEHTSECYGYKVYYTDDVLSAEILIRNIEDLPSNVELNVNRITAASDPAGYVDMLAAMSNKLQGSPYYMGGASFYQMKLLLDGQEYRLPETAKTNVKVSFNNPVFSPEAVEDAVKMETFLLEKEQTSGQLTLSGTFESSMQQSNSSGTDATGEAEQTVTGSTVAQNTYQVEQVAKETYENVSGGITGVVFETDMLSSFAMVLSNPTKTGVFWERVYSTADIESGGTYMIVSAEGNFALRGNENNNYTRVMIQAQDGEEDPDAVWTDNPERNTRYYTITLSDGTPVDNNLYWTFTGSGNKYVVQNQATSIYLALSRIRTGGTFIPRYTEYFMHTVSAELTLTNVTPENVWRISNYSDLRNAGTGAFAKRSASSNDSTGSNYSSEVTYYYTEDMLIFKLSDVTSLSVPEDFLADENIGSDGSVIAPEKPDYGEFIDPTDGLTGDTGVTSDEGTVSGKYYSDPSTSDIETQFRQDSYEASTKIDGKVVTDKSVIYGDDDYDAFSSYDPNTFSVALSALGQEYEIPYQYMVKTPVDVVFVLDLSGSMSSNSEDDDTNPERIEDLCGAVNASMAQILEDHEANRVGIAVYSSGAWQMLPLDRYTADNGQYLVNNKKTYSHDPSDLSLTITYLQGSPSLRSESGVSYANVGSDWNQGVGTYTQAGIAMGNEIFEAIGDDTTYTTMLGEGEYARPYTVTRQPVFILLSDGEPTHSTPIYNDVLKGPHYGNGLSGATNGKGIHGYYTVLSANYYKRAVSNQYKKKALFYTVGMSINATEDTPLTGNDASTGDNYKRAVLNPEPEFIENLTADRAKDITTDQLKGMLLGTYANDYVEVNHDFPEAWYGVPHRYEPVLKPNPYADNYSYSDGGYFGELPEEELEKIFSEIYQSSVTVTPYGFVLYKNSSVNVVDNIGTGMEIKGVPVLRYNGVNYTNPKITQYENTTTYVYEGTVADPYLPSRRVNLAEITVSVTTDANGDQTVYMYVPDTALPTYTPELIGREFYYEQLPVRLIYQVGLTEEAEAEVLALRKTGGEKVFYTNKWSDDDISTSTLLPSVANPFYYDADGDGTEPPYKAHHSVKSENTTETVDYHVDCHREIEVVAGDVLIEVIHKQGNNGKLVFEAEKVVEKEPISVSLKKNWAEGINSNIMNPVTITLYKVTETVDAEGNLIRNAEVDSTVVLSGENNWETTVLREKSKEENWYFAVAENAVPGYHTSYDYETIKVTADGGETYFDAVKITESGMTVNVTNSVSVELPSTGGIGILGYTFGGLLLIIMSAALLLYKAYFYRRREEGSSP